MTHRDDDDVTRPTFRSALRQRQFTALLTCHGLGTVAQLMLTMAVGIAVLDETGSGIWTSLVVAFGFAPYVAFSGLAGVVADRYDRPRVMRWSVAARGLICALLTVGVWLSAPVWFILVAMALAAVIATPSYPALAAATPQIVDDKQLPPANALVTTVENATWIAGPGAAGVVLLLGGPIWAVPAIATSLFLAAGLAIVRVRVPLPARPDESSGTWRELIDGLQVVLTELRVRTSMGYAIVDNFLYGYLVVLVLLVATEQLQAGDLGIGWLNAALTTGAFAAIAVTNRFASSKQVGHVLIAQMAVLVACVGFLAFAPSLQVAVTLVFFAGGACLIAEVVAVTVMQRSAPDEVCARVFGVYDQLNVGAIALGSALAGPLAQTFGLSTSILIVAVVAGILGMSSALRVGHHIGVADIRGEPAPTSDTSR